MFYGNIVSISNTNNNHINDMYNIICTECNNFDNMINSINILNENNILLEIDTSKIKKKISDIWEALKRFIKGIINKLSTISSKFNKQNIKKIVDEKFKTDKGNKEDKTEENKEVEVLKPTDKFIKTFESEYTSKVNEFVEKMKGFSDKLYNIAKGKSAYNKEELENEAGQLNRILSELENDIFKDCGGINKIFYSNRDCFEVYTSSDKTEVENILNKNMDYYNNNVMLIVNISKVTGDLAYTTGGGLDTSEDRPYLNFELTKQFNYLAENTTNLIAYMFGINNAIFQATKNK
jgi:hypothetical protein